MQHKLTLYHALYEIDLSIDIIWEMWGNEQQAKHKTHSHLATQHTYTGHTSTHK